MILTFAISEHARTRPASNYMLTNCEDVFKKPAEQYFEDSWDNGERHILKDLHNAKYRVNFYTKIEDMFGKGQSTKEYVNNFSTNSNNLNVKGILKSLIFLSGYRYAPVTMKPFFWCYTEDVNKSAYLNGTMYAIDETEYGNGVNRIEAIDEKYFKFYHFNGSHPPYTINENGDKSNEPTSSLEQTKGNFNILYKAFDKMKELGIYDDATIIITADHGSAVSDYDPVSKST